MTNVSLIIPSYKPDDKLLTTLDSAIKAGFKDILVVDDGGGKKFAHIFDRVREMKECTVLVHPKNKGKGAALKTAFTYFLANRKGIAGVVTADADGQHRAEDIVSVARKMEESGNIVLGYRDFSLDHVPKKSRYGNRITAGVFRVFFGMKVKDTQTGLRAFPTSVLEEMCNVKGDRYEYETHMLIDMSRHRLPFEEVKIETVYIEENKGSHFRPVIDSLRIYAILIKYLFCSVVSTVVDAVVFFLLKHFDFLSVIPIPLTYTAGFIARAVSSCINFAMNSKIVFGERMTRRAVLKYYILVVIQICISVAAVFGIEKLFSIDSAAISTIIKLIVDTLLFFFSFRIQHKWVFNCPDKRRKKK